jgi:hypothetical protein
MGDAEGKKEYEMKLETVLIGGLYVLAIIGCVISYHLGAEMERLKQDAACSDNWRPMPLPFINEFTLRQMSVVHTSATNPAPFDRRRRPICKPDSAVE